MPDKPEHMGRYLLVIEWTNGTRSELTRVSRKAIDDIISLIYGDYRVSDWTFYDLPKLTPAPDGNLEYVRPVIESMKDYTLKGKAGE